LKPVKPLEFDSRVLAVDHFSKLDEARALSSANKRVANILADVKDDLGSYRVDQSLFREPEEKVLASLLGQKEEDVAPLFEARNYQEGLAQLSMLKEPVDHFFDKVLVMDEDQALRHNRVALLKRLRDLFLQVADISYLHKP